jgi:hypothetical protein
MALRREAWIAAGIGGVVPGALVLAAMLAQGMALPATERERLPFIHLAGVLGTYSDSADGLKS